MVRDLWCFDIKSRQWSQVLLSVDSQTPLAVVGHTATVLHSKMVVLFGYSEEEHFSNTVQEFDLGKCHGNHLVVECVLEIIWVDSMKTI